MGKIIDVVQAFLREMEWNWEQVDEHRLRVAVSGESGRWTWLAMWPDDESLFSSYSICPVNVPLGRRLAVAEFITLANYGLLLGNFELDMADGEVRFKTSVPLRKVRLTRPMVRELAFCGFSLMDRYLPSLLAVAFGRLSPRKAIAAAEQPAEPEPDEPTDDDGPAEPVARAERVAQMAEHLRLMKARTLNEAKSHCFIVFCAEPPVEPGRDKGGRRPRVRIKPSLRRMVQFCFHDDWFAIDIPNTSIAPREAERLLANRPGFYREAEKPDADVSDVDQIVEFDPVGRRYAYGQEPEAAEDAAWFFFDLCGLPPSQPIYVSASSFKTDHRWERGELLA